MPEPGSIRVDADAAGTFLSITHVQACPEIGPACDAGPQQSYLHHQSLSLANLDLGMEAGIVPGLSLLATVPLKTMRATVHYTTLAGAPYDPPDAGIHHHNEVLAGPGDPVFSLRAGRTFGTFFTSARLGASLPLGKTQPNPWTLGREGKPHEHFQFGTGIVAPVIALDAIVPGPLATEISGTLEGTLSLYENSHGWRPPSHGSLGVAASRAVSQKIQLRAGVDLLRENAERWSRDQPTAEGNLGRTDVIASLRGSYALSDKLFVRAGVSASLYTKATGEQLSQPGTLSLGLSWAPR